MKVRAIYRFVYLLLVITATGIVTNNNAQDPSVRQIGGGVGITVFRDRNFRGGAVTFTTDQPNLATSGFNNQISSVRVGPGEFWQMCDQPNFRGQCVTVSREESDLRTSGWNDRATSLRRVSGGGTPVPPGSNGIVLFDRINFRGQDASFFEPTRNLGGFNRRAESVRVTGGEWQLCEGINFTGRCMRVRSDTRTLGLMRNRIQSVRPTGFTPTPIPPPTSGLITLFDQRNYLGNPTSFNTTRPNIQKFAMSATVQSGTWLLCDGISFSGRCITLNQSVWDLTNYNIGRTIRSIRPVER